MGQYKLSIDFAWQIMLGIEINDFNIVIAIPFTNIYIATQKEAKGVSIYGKEF